VIYSVYELFVLTPLHHTQVLLILLSEPNIPDKTPSPNPVIIGIIYLHKIKLMQVTVWYGLIYENRKSRQHICRLSFCQMRLYTKWWDVSSTHSGRHPFRVITVIIRTTIIIINTFVQHHTQTYIASTTSFQYSAENSHNRSLLNINLLLLPADWVGFWGLPCHTGLAEAIPPSSGEPLFMLPVLAMLPPWVAALSCMFSASSPANHRHN